MSSPLVNRQAMSVPAAKGLANCRFVHPTLGTHYSSAPHILRMSDDKIVMSGGDFLSGSPTNEVFVAESRDLAFKSLSSVGLQLPITPTEHFLHYAPTSGFTLIDASSNPTLWRRPSVGGDPDEWMYTPGVWTNTAIPVGTEYKIGRKAGSSACSLPDGRFLLFSGILQGNPSERNREVLVYDPVSNSWSEPISNTPSAILYGVVALPDGRVVVVGAGSTTYILDITAGTLTPVASHPSFGGTPGDTSITTKVHVVLESQTTVLAWGVRSGNPTSVYRYDVTLDTWTDTTSSFGNFEGGVLLPDGDFFHPGRDTWVRADSSPGRVYKELAW